MCYHGEFGRFTSHGVVNINRGKPNVEERWGSVPLPTFGLEGVADPKMMMIGLLYNEAQHDAKVAQTTLTYILTVHRNEKIKNKKNMQKKNSSIEMTDK